MNAIARVAHKDAMLAKAEKQFRFYEEQHRAKNTEDSRVKAEVNAHFAEMCAEALAL